MNNKLSLSLLASLVILAIIATVVGAAAQESDAADRTPTPTDEELAANNFGCPEGTRFWMRDSQTPLCARLCTSDADCSANEGRCRLLDVGDRSEAPPVLLVDDMTDEQVSSVIANANPPAIPVCDPFFFVVGATDADDLSN